GNYVQNSDPNGIVVLTQLQPISVIFTLPEDNLPSIQKRLREGATLEVSAYDRSNNHLLATGQLGSVDNQVDVTTGTVKFRALFGNEDGSLFPNQFVNARLLVDTLHNAVRIPVAAVQQGEPGSYVWLIGANDTVTVRPVKLGPTDGNMVAVLSGLAVGDRVVTDGTDRLREGQKVIIPGHSAESGGHAPEHRRQHGAPPGQK
ncbi:MAG: efflux RND transporter periplasmic adaptor subunit, partial [Acetobacteraceae bacterium]|nr:efflux RND transporter periplasmic adaptor subunit [Acetobacteraceae bacterium]